MPIAIGALALELSNTQSSNTALTVMPVFAVPLPFSQQSKTRPVVLRALRSTKVTPSKLKL